MCKLLAQQLTDQVIISRKRRPGETSKSLVIKKPKVLKTKLYSNSLANCVKTFCCGCDQAINLSLLRKHVRSHHEQSLLEYRKLYGSPEKQIIQLVYHTCTICNKDVVLDYDTLNKHMRSQHKSTFASYRGANMVQNSPIFAMEAEMSTKSPILKTPPKLENETRVTLVMKGCGGSPPPPPAPASAPPPASSSLILSTIPHLAKYTVKATRLAKSISL